MVTDFENKLKMRKELFDASLRSVLPDSAFIEIRQARSTPLIQRPTSLGNHKPLLESGTTVLAFHFNKGIIMAGDRQTSSGFSVVSSESLKVNKIGSHSGFMFAGWVGDGQMVTSVLRKVDADFTSRFQMSLSLEGQANYLVRLMRAYYEHGSFLGVWGIIAGLSVIPTEFKIYNIEPSGSKLTGDFMTEGSGGPEAESVLKRFKGRIKDRSLNFKEALDLAVSAIYASGDTDMGTSDVRIAIPTIAVITQVGFNYIKENTVKVVCEALIKKERESGNVR